jgi:hypothetical protein
MRRASATIDSLSRLDQLYALMQVTNPQEAEQSYRGLQERVRFTASFESLRFERDRLRAALVGLVGMDGRVDLEQLEAVMRLTPAPAADKAVTIDAIHALLATLEEPT